MSLGMIVAIAVAIICFGAAISAAFGDAKVVATALEGMARQPEAYNRLFTSMLIGMGMLEVMPLITIVIAFMLIGKIA